MRELKFRAWGTNINEYMGIPNNPSDVVNILGELINRGTWIIEQYTGLKDKNGKDIYEGDIVLVDNRDYSPYIVVYREWDCSFICENDDREETVRICNKTPQRYEVIGNIHENSELIGGK